MVSDDKAFYFVFFFMYDSLHISNRERAILQEYLTSLGQNTHCLVPEIFTEGSFAKEEKKDISSECCFSILC